MAEEFKLPLQGKTAIVTGASRGLGHGMAWEMARRGADVCLTYVSDRSAQPAQEMADKIGALPHRPTAYICQADISTVEGPGKIISSLLEKVGKDLKIHILVNNAGVEVNKTLADMKVEDYDQCYNLNVRGTCLMTQAVLPYLPPKGRIINISSVGSRSAFPSLSLYCSSKAAIEGLTRCWAAELGHNGTTVNAVNPGPVQSDMLDNIPKDIIDMQKAWTPVEKRLGTVEEVAKIVAWLASEDSSWVTAQVISASGGYAQY